MKSNNEENELMYIYEWVDSLPLSRPKKNISRDFCDAGLLAEIIKHYYPKLVELHNYPPASSSNQKCYNWTTLNNKVLKKIGITLKKDEINDAISCKSMAIEHILQKVYVTIEKQKGKINVKGDSKSNGGANINALKNTLENKKNTLFQLREIVKNLQIQLQKSTQYKSELEKRIEDLSYQLQLNQNI